MIDFNSKSLKFTYNMHTREKHITSTTSIFGYTSNSYNHLIDNLHKIDMFYSKSQSLCIIQQRIDYKHVQR